MLPVILVLDISRHPRLTSSKGSVSSPRSSSSFQFWKSTLSQCCLVLSLSSLSHQTGLTFSSLNSTTLALTAYREAWGVMSGRKVRSCV